MAQTAKRDTEPVGHQSVLTAGVMIALALVPAATLTGMGLATGSFDVAGKASLRWALEVALVCLFSGLVFLWKRASVHRRDGRQ